MVKQLSLPANTQYNTHLDKNYRVSNMKYESVRVDSKTVVFIIANPGKKETTDGSGLRVNFIRDWCTFSEVVSSEKWHVTKNFKFAVTGKISLFPDR